MAPDKNRMSSDALDTHGRKRRELGNMRNYMGR
jgi:hypothetical protein